MQVFSFDYRYKAFKKKLLSKKYKMPGGFTKSMPGSVIDNTFELYENTSTFYKSYGGILTSNRSDPLIYFSAIKAFFALPEFYQFSYKFTDARPLLHTIGRR